jgi:exodeoxyribonuclease V alpha subunit
MSETAELPVPFAPDIALGAPEPLAAFNRAGVLSAADVHVAMTLCRLAGPGAATVGDEALLATALAVRAPRLGHVFVDLASVSATVSLDGEEHLLDGLEWPDADAWPAALAACAALVAVGEDESVRPLRLLGSRLYLDRYWRQERALAETLLGFARTPVRPLELAELAAVVQRLLPEDEHRLQRAAAGAAALRSLTVVAGGPGTGKTTTVARICALLGELAADGGGAPPLIALCAPTGKAAARLQEAVREEAGRIAIDESVREWLGGLGASTIHRLLGWRPGARGRFRHDAANRLPHDVVIVDETSMVPLTLMARLLEAIRSDARLVLVGDSDQLTAIEAGAVLRDIVGPAAGGLRLRPGAKALLERVAGGELEAPAAIGASQDGAFGDGVVVLTRGLRFGAEIGALADAVRRGDGDGAVAAIERAGEAIRWLRVDAGALAPGELDVALEPLRAAAVGAGETVITAARLGDGAAALGALGAFRLLCAHRHGRYGVAVWAAQVERWLAAAVDGFAPGARDQPGRPLLITRNDYELRLFNGEVGVVARSGDDAVQAMFERDGELIGIAPSRLDAVETLYATTVHKSQGSQFGTAAVLLPGPDSRLLTRELLYTAITRAREHLILVCAEEALQVAVARPVARATGLRERLWAV